jgi:hypothetical protein
MTISTWLYADAPDEESVYPQVGARSSSPEFQAVYWRCVGLFYVLARRSNPDASLVFFTNTDALPTVDGVDLEALLGRLGVEVEQVALTYAPPPTYHPAWRNQFYVLNLIERLAHRTAPDEVCFLLDSDCLWIRPADAFAGVVQRSGLASLVIPYPPDETINGLTRREMQALFADLSGAALGSPPPYLGGEVFAATGAAAARVAAELPALWPELMRRFRSGEPYFREEAHLLSYVYWKLGFEAGGADPFMRRIWTTLVAGRGHDAQPADLDLAVWHLPAEKRYGIHRLFGEVADLSSPLWTLEAGPDLRRHLARRLGVPRRSPLKLARDLTHAVPYKARKLLSQV